MRKERCGVVKGSNQIPKQELRPSNALASYVGDEGVGVAVHRAEAGRR